VPFFPLIQQLDYPEKIVVRYFDEALRKIGFIENKNELKSYFNQLFEHFKEIGVWDKVRIISDEPKIHEIDTFKASLAELKS
ncbi:neuraminidase NanP, partial [Bacillus cereus]|uniref:glycoside hydrolase domain-containing protein n=1 Tax=Bacillus cereus TaxID=1396 RepID=UPI00283AF1B9|nr:neuraminidase NanP [Bacillus cereus]